MQPVGASGDPCPLAALLPTAAPLGAGREPWQPGSALPTWKGGSPDLSPQSLELIRKHGFSAALFAPGWVYECLEKKDFFQNQDK